MNKAAAVRPMRWNSGRTPAFSDGRQTGKSPLESTMKIKTILATAVTCLLASSAWADLEINDSQQLLAGGTGVYNSTGKHTQGADDRHDPGSHTQDESILDHEKSEDAKDMGTGTDGVDSHTTGSGTTSESIPSNIPPARERQE
jgi:uncharacterized membrane protein